MKSKLATRADLERASHEVDRTLIRWALSLTPRERLRAATRTARMLGRFRRAGPPAAS
ncbi:MAG: hypothetical protein ACYTEG_13845 [Planctomycetota bacterium]